MCRLLPALLLSGCAFISNADHQIRKGQLQGNDTEAPGTTEDIDLDLIIESLDPPGMSACSTETNVHVQAKVAPELVGEAASIAYRFDDSADWIDAGDFSVEEGFGDTAQLDFQLVVRPPPPGPSCTDDEACGHPMQFGVTINGVDDEAEGPADFIVVPDIEPTIVDGGLVGADATYHPLDTIPLIIGDNPLNSFHTSEYPVIAVAITHPLFQAFEVLSFDMAACPDGVDPRISDSECVKQNGTGGQPPAGIAGDSDIVVSFDTSAFPDPMCNDLGRMYRLWLQVNGDPCGALDFVDLNTPGLRFVHDDCDGDGFTVADGDCDDGGDLIYPGLLETCDGIDNNCDLAIDEDFDIDGDGYTTCSGDCDDLDVDINPNAFEHCDGLDNDCDVYTVEMGPVTVGGVIYQTVQEGVDAALPGEVVGICAVTFFENIVSTGDVIVRGAGIGATVINGSNNGSVWTHSAGDLDLDGVRLTNGAAVTNGGGIDGTAMGIGDTVTLANSEVDNSDSPNFGGGIYATNVTLENTIVQINTAENSGGGIFTTGAVEIDSLSVVSGNQADFYGGGIHALSVNGSGLVQGNTAAYGGGISGLDSLSVTGGTRLDLNMALAGLGGVGDGGGLHCDPCSVGGLTIDSATFTNNTADSFGGGLFAGNTEIVTIDDSFFNGNGAAIDGGAMQLWNGTNPATLTDVDLTFNTALAFGGAICSDRHDVVISESDIEDNTAVTGGAIYFTGTARALTLTSIGFDRNSATTSGGALFLDDATVTNVGASTLDQNFADQGGAIRANGTLTVAGTDFTQNEAVNGRGGAIWVDAAGAPENVDITGGQMQLNIASDAGGAIWVGMGPGVTFLDNVHLNQNTASSGDGGAILVESSIELADCLLTDNQAASGGAAAVDGPLAYLEAVNTDWAAPIPMPGHNLANDIQCAAGISYDYTMQPQLCCTNTDCQEALCP